MIYVKPIEQLNRAYKVATKKHSNNYPAIKERDLKKIKRILKADPTAQVYVGRNWVRINGQSFNGITKEEVEKIKQEITCNIAINVV